MSRKLLPLLILAIGIAGFVLLKMTRPEPAQVTATERSWRVQVQTVEPGTHTPVLPLYGEVVAPDQVSIAATLAGRIGERPVAEGQQVHQGDLLLALDQMDVKPVLAQAEAQVADLQAQIRSEQVRYRNDLTALESETAIEANARRQLERTRSLVERNLASREALESSTDALARAELTVRTRQRSVDEHPARKQSLDARLAQAEANLESTRRDAERARVVAPFDGVVTGVQVAPGDQVSRNQTLLTIYPDQGLELRATVPEMFRAELQAALSAGEQLRAWSEGGRHAFRLARFAGMADPAGTEAILTLAGEASGLRPGALLPVTLERPARAQSVAIPFSALYGADAVYLMNSENRMQRVQVERIGEARSDNGERQLVVAGEDLVPGARLITTHLPNAVTGLKVDLAGEPEE
ncbi:biotin/lipoyl-binding protein [Marinobacter salinexigens]|uniref:Biotin/lipoyl-binding protein n=1 Tax=Marinobacter salinexigens TaxID=2919747 RepID=A0A5B0VJE4_9GAMM|nr:HlyD family efflux transporter periplasmic adaptor subunit [Marinobacter salinexigens]KAA1174393.1 biotin/lipoyl-binding protein [Marinobacter salinexigens]